MPKLVQEITGSILLQGLKGGAGGGEEGERGRVREVEGVREGTEKGVGKKGEGEQK